MTISNYAEQKLLDHVTGRLAFTAPTGVYIKLHTGNPDATAEDGTSNPATETTRKVVTFSAAASPAGTITSSATVEWTNYNAGGSGLTNTLSHWSLWDTVGPTGGNCLWTGSLSSNATVTHGDTFQITSLTLTLD